MYCVYDECVFRRQYIYGGFIISLVRKLPGEISWEIRHIWTIVFLCMLKPNHLRPKVKLISHASMLTTMCCYTPTHWHERKAMRHTRTNARYTSY